MTTLRDTLDSLLSLQAIDSQRDLLFRNLNAMDNGAKIVAESAAAEAAEAAARKTSQTTNSSLKAAELELESMEKKIQLLEKRISSGAIVNTKELLNNEKELSQLNRLRSTLDEKILGLMPPRPHRKKNSSQKKLPSMRLLQNALKSSWSSPKPVPPEPKPHLLCRIRSF
jgi:predicted  nucleic acid-binding Zn-ribbon protein